MEEGTSRFTILGRPPRGDAGLARPRYMHKVTILTTMIIILIMLIVTILIMILVLFVFVL